MQTKEHRLLRSKHQRALRRDSTVLRTGMMAIHVLTGKDMIVSRSGTRDAALMQASSRLNCHLMILRLHSVTQPRFSLVQDGHRIDPHRASRGGAQR